VFGGFHLQAMLAQNRARLLRLVRLCIGLRALPRQRPGGGVGRLRLLRHVTESSQGALQQFGRLRVLPHSEAEIPGAIERIELRVQRRRPLQVPGPLGGLGGPHVQAAPLEQRRRPQVITGAHVHLPGLEELVGLLVQAGGLGRLILVFPHPARVHKGPSALVGVGRRLPVRHLLVEATRVDVGSLADKPAGLRRAGGAGLGPALLAQQPRNQPQEPQADEYQRDGAGQGAIGEITDPPLTGGEAVPNAFDGGRRPVLNRSLGGGVGCQDCGGRDQEKPQCD
jgi:hypothetical protein